MDGIDFTCDFCGVKQLFLKKTQFFSLYTPIAEVTRRFCEMKDELPDPGAVFQYYGGNL